MKIKKIKLVVGHSSWWKRKKYRKEASEILSNYRLKGWKLKNIADIVIDQEEIESRIFKVYFLKK